MNIIIRFTIFTLSGTRSSSHQGRFGSGHRHAISGRRGHRRPGQVQYLGRSDQLGRQFNGRLPGAEWCDLRQCVCDASTWHRRYRLLHLPCAGKWPSSVLDWEGTSHFSISKPHTTVVKLMASSGTGGICNAATVGTGANVLVTGMLAWLTVSTSSSILAFNKASFVPSTLSAAELTALDSQCSTIGSRVCNSTCP